MSKPQHVTRIRLHLAIYFCLHTGSLPKNTARWQARLAALWRCRVERKRGRIRRVKYWEIIIENLRNAEWNCGCMTTTDDKGRPIWVVAAERSDDGRFVVHADKELPAFLELESES
jgi:hypothetical protein